MTLTGKCLSCFSSVSKFFGKGVQNFFKASHCLLITGGVKCKKFGIFMSSAFANLPGGALFSGTHPWRIGRGTVAGWKLRGPGQTAPQSWSIAICWVRGGGTSTKGPLLVLLSMAAFDFVKFKTRNSEKKLKIIFHCLIGSFQYHLHLEVLHWKSLVANTPDNRNVVLWEPHNLILILAAFFSCYCSPNAARKQLRRREIQILKKLLKNRRKQLLFKLV